MINGKGYDSFDVDKLDNHWKLYKLYKEKGSGLYNITQKILVTEVNNVKKMEKPFIDSQILINKVLTDLGNKHNFHRQFDEQFSGMKKGNILGMQLYTVVLKDNLDWIFYETKNFGHKYSHATYFIPDKN